MVLMFELRIIYVYISLLGGIPLEAKSERAHSWGT